MKRANLYLEKKCIGDIFVADTFWTRFMGLMGKKSEQISDMKGLFIKPCSQIHTFFMKAPIDVVYLSDDFKVVYVDENVQPWRCCHRVKGAKCLVEFPVGKIQEFEIRENKKLEVIYNE